VSRWSDTIDQKLKRAGALALTFWTVLLLPTGLGLVLLGVSTRIEHREWQEPLSIGVGLVAVGAITWYLSRRLHEGARQVRARMDENRILRLASQRGGRLTAMEAATETGRTAGEAEASRRGRAEGGRDRSFRRGRHDLPFPRRPLRTRQRQMVTPLRVGVD